MPRRYALWKIFDVFRNRQNEVRFSHPKISRNSEYAPSFFEKQVSPRRFQGNAQFCLRFRVFPRRLAIHFFGKSLPIPLLENSDGERFVDPIFCLSHFFHSGFPMRRLFYSVFWGRYVELFDEWFEKLFEIGFFKHLFEVISDDLPGGAEALFCRLVLFGGKIRRDEGGEKTPLCVYFSFLHVRIQGW